MQNVSVKCIEIMQLLSSTSAFTVRYNWPMFAHASQVFSIAHCTDSEDLTFLIAHECIINAHLSVYIFQVGVNQQLYG